MGGCTRAPRRRQPEPQPARRRASCPKPRRGKWPALSGPSARRRRKRPTVLWTASTGPCSATRWPRSVATTCLPRCERISFGRAARRRPAPFEEKSMNDFEDIILPRSGKAPLVFRGQQLAVVFGQRHLGREHNRWHELVVYRTEGGRYMVRIAYR